MSRFFTSTLAQALHGFLTDFLPCQRNMSLHSLHSYRDSLKLLLKFVAGKRGDPSTLTVEQLTVERVTAFLRYLENDRKNRASTRNVRLSAIHSFFRYVGTQHPEHLEQTQHLLGIPFKRIESREIQHLNFAELQAVLGGINRSTRQGQRDFTLLSLLFNTGAHLLRSGVDLSTIAHWMGHASLNTTNKYLSLDLEAKREALAKAKPLMKSGSKAGTWRRDTDLIAWLENL